MTTKTDSFDRSRHGDAFVHSRVDERNLSIVVQPPRGKMVLLFQTYGGMAHAWYGHGYVNGDFQDPMAPLYREDHETGTAKWDEDYALYNTRRSRWNTGESDMRSGVLHMETYIPMFNNWFTLPLRPWARTGDTSGWPVVVGRPWPDLDMLEDQQRLTRALVDPGAEVYSITLILDVVVTNAHPWLWNTPWVEWARATFTNQVDAIDNWPLHGIQAYSMPFGGIGRPLRELHRWLALGNELIGAGSWN
jgi:hypothetical protein